MGAERIHSDHGDKARGGGTCLAPSPPRGPLSRAPARGQPGQPPETPGWGVLGGSV